MPDKQQPQPEPQPQPQPEPQPPPPPPPRQPEPRLFGAFDAGAGGLARALPRGLFEGWPLSATVDEQQGGGGRSVVAARDLQQGEVILEAQPFSTAVVPEQLKRVCAVCLTRVPGRAPARVAGAPARVHACRCGQATYCSAACEQAPEAAWHRQHECAGARRIAAGQGGAEPTLLARLVFNTLMRGAHPGAPQEGTPPGGWHDGILLLESHAAHRSPAQRSVDRVAVNLVRAALQAQQQQQQAQPQQAVEGATDDDITVAAQQQQRPQKLFPFERITRFPTLLTALVSAVQCNNFGIFEGGGDSGTAAGRGVSTARGVFPVASFFNHACAPNVVRSSSGGGGGQLVFRASCPIAAGEALCIMYGELSDRSYAERQRHLTEHYSFVCQCPRCAAEAPRRQPQQASRGGGSGGGGSGGGGSGYDFIKP